MQPFVRILITYGLFLGIWQFLTQEADASMATTALGAECGGVCLGVFGEAWALPGQGHIA